MSYLQGIGEWGESPYTDVSWEEAWPKESHFVSLFMPSLQISCNPNMGLGKWRKARRNVFHQFLTDG